MQSITCSCIMDRSIFLLESFSNLLLISNAIIWTHQELGWLVITCKITDICCIVDEYYCKVMLKHYFTQRYESVFDCNIIVRIIQENMLHWIMQSKNFKMHVTLEQKFDSNKPGSMFLFRVYIWKRNVVPKIHLSMHLAGEMANPFHLNLLW